MCGVHEGGQVREGDGRRPHCFASRRPEALLGPEQLAGPLPPAPQQEDEEGGPDTRIPLLIIKTESLRFFYGILV